MRLSLNNIKKYYSWISENSSLFKQLDEDFEDKDQPFFSEICSEHSYNLEHIFKVIKYWNIESLPVHILEKIKNKEQILKFLWSLRKNKEEIVFIEKYINFISLNDEEIPYYAAEQGYIDLLNWCIYKNIHIPHEVYFKTKDIQVVNWLIDNDVKLDNYVISHIITLQNIKLLEKCFSKFSERSDIFLSEAVESGNIELCKWLRNQNCPFDDDLPSTAIENGYISLFEWLIENNCPYDENIMMDAVLSDSLEIVQYIFNRGYEKSRNSCFNAVKIGNLQILKWLISKNFYFNATECFKRVSDKTGNDVLDFLKENGLNFTFSLYIIAIERDYINIVKWLHKNNYPLNNTCLEISLICNSYKCVDYFMELDIKFSYKTSLCAVNRQRLDVLILLGYVDRGILQKAFYVNSLEIVQWIIDQHYEITEEDLLNVQTKEMMELIINNGISVNENVIKEYKK